MRALLKIIKVIIALAALAAVIAFIAERIEEIRNKGAKFLHKPHGKYERFIKRPLDCFLSTGALIVLSPVMLLLTIIGTIKMKGNPFFTQDRPGRIDTQTGKERVFKLIKFRSMTNERDENGNLLPDEKRLPKYGKLLRASSADELGELFNIIKGDMAVVGPRPWAVSYLDYFTSEEHQRHSVRPGLTGLAQVNGRTAANWGERLNYDMEYVNYISFMNDVKIIYLTVKKVFVKADIVEAGCQGDFDEYRKKQWDDGSVPRTNSDITESIDGDLKNTFGLKISNVE